MAPLLRGFTSNSNIQTKLPLITICTAFSLVIGLVICASCCRRKKKSDKKDEQKSIQLKSPSEVTTMPPRDPPVADGLSQTCFTFAYNLYRWSSRIQTRRSVFTFPTAMQVAFGPYYEAAKGMTRRQLVSALLPMITETHAEEILKNLIVVVSPKSVGGIQSGWQFAVRMYAPKKRLDQFCPEYRKQFDELNELSGKIMEIIGFTKMDLKQSSPKMDELNAWAKQTVAFMERPLYELAEKKLKNFFLNKPDPRLVLFNVCGFRCQLQYPFRGADTSKVGHPFMCYDGRKFIHNLPMMHSNEENEKKVYYYYLEDEDCQLLRIPLKRPPQSETEVALYFLLPKERAGLRALEKKIKADTILEKLQKCVQPEHVRIVIPKMRLDCHLTNMVAGLKSMGAISVFDPKSAELAYMLEADEFKKLERTSAPKSDPLIVGRMKTRIKSPVRKTMMKTVAGKTSKLHDVENLCVTDVVQAGAFHFLDDDDEVATKKPQNNKPVFPSPSLNGSKITMPSVTPSVSSDGTIGSKTVTPSLISKTCTTHTTVSSSETKTSTTKEESATSTGTTASTATEKSEKKNEKESSFEKSGKQPPKKSEDSSTPTKSGEEPRKKSPTKEIRKSLLPGSSTQSSAEQVTTITKESSSKESLTPSKTMITASKTMVTASKKEVKRGIFANLNKKKDRGGDSGSKMSEGKGSMGSARSSPEADESPCPICTRMETRGEIPQLRRFVADHPFIWLVVIEKPQLIPLVVGRFCGQQTVMKS